MTGIYWSLYHCEQGCGHRFQVEYQMIPFRKEKAVSCPVCGRTDFKFIEDYEIIPY